MEPEDEVEALRAQGQVVDVVKMPAPGDPEMQELLDTLRSYDPHADNTALKNASARYIALLARRVLLGVEE